MVPHIHAHVLGVWGGSAMAPNKQYFILDPDFPNRLAGSGYLRTIDFLRFLFETYSQCGLTVELDRDTAIYGLVQRIGRVLSAEARYGIVRCFLSSLLLWRRSDDQKTVPIDYGDRTVPSWSWMAYSGGIDFISDVRQSLMIPEFAELDFADDSEALTVKIRRFENFRIDQDGKQFTVFARSRSGPTRGVGSLWFDVTDRIDFRHCVVVGMVKDTQETHYILVVQEKASGGGYERLGVGKVEARYISRDCEGGILW